MKKLFVVCGLGMLAACSGGSGGAPGVTVGAATESVGDLPVVVRYDSATSSYFVTRAGIPETELPELPDYEIGTFRAAFVDLPFGNQYAILISETAASQAIVYVRDDELVSVTATRLSDTTMPGSGSATLTGDYAGVVQNAPGDPIFAAVRGDAEITVDFGNAVVSGVVRNRAYLDDDDPSVALFDLESADLVLSETSLSLENGTFSGTTSGGDLVVNPGTALEQTVSPTAGRFAGLIGGPDGTEAVVGVEATFTSGTESLVEYGAIAAGH